MASRNVRSRSSAARAAGQLLHAELRAAHRIAFKGTSTNLVTEMDERAEELVVGRLAEAFPDDTILAEERGAARGRSGRRWIVDPLDGTTNYAHGVPIFCVSIALEVEGRVELGVAYDPSFDEAPTSPSAGGGHRERRAPRRLDDGHARREPAHDGLSLRHPRDLATRICRNTRRSRSGAGACAASAPRCSISRWVAAGRFDGFWELRLGSWDVAAGSLFVEEAGGRVTNLVGGALDLNAPAVVASNGRIHEAMLTVLRQTRQA